jgi:hypothetical protein
MTMPAFIMNPAPSLRGDDCCPRVEASLCAMPSPGKRGGRRGQDVEVA